MAGIPTREKEKGWDSSKEKEYMAGTPAREAEKDWDSSKDIWRGFPQLNDDMVGIPTRKGLGFQKIYGVTNLISKHERGRKRREIGVTWFIAQMG